MADLSIVKIKVRRGTDSDRKRVILDEGEVGFTTDTQRLYIGDGNTLGGVNIANKFLGRGSVSSFGSAVVGDLVYDTTLNNLFALTAQPPSLSANWTNLGPKTDSTTVFYNSAFNLGVMPGSMTRKYVNSRDIVNLGLSATSDNQILVDLDNRTLKFNGNKIYADTSTFAVSTFKSDGFGLDCTGLKASNLPVLTLADIPSGPAYVNLPMYTVYILNEPPSSNFYYMMIKQ